MTAFDKFCPIDGFSSKYLWQDLKVHVFNSRRPKFQNEFTVHFTVHYMGWRYPSHASTLRPHELAQCVNPRVGPLITVALHLLIGRVWMYVAIPSSQVDSSAPLVGRSDPSDPRGRACRPNGKQTGEEGVVYVVILHYLYCPAFNVSVL